MVEARFEWKHNRDLADATARLAELQDALKRSLADAMEEATLRVMATARRLVNVDTGRLRASIEQEVRRIGKELVKGYIGSNVTYAVWHELDFPFLRPAIEAERAVIRRIFIGAVDDAVREAKRV